MKSGTSVDSVMSENTDRRILTKDGIISSATNAKFLKQLCNISGSSIYYYFT